LVSAKMALAGETCFEAASEVQTSSGKKMLVKRQKRDYQPPVKDFQDLDQDPQFSEADAEAKSEIEAATGTAENVLPPTLDQDPLFYEADAEAKSEIEVATGTAENALPPTSASDQSQMILEDVQDLALEDVEKSSMMQDDSEDRSVTESKGWGKGKTEWTTKHWSNEECKESGKYSSTDRYPNRMAKKGKPQFRDHCIYWDCKEKDAEWKENQHRCKWVQRNGKWEFGCIGYCEGQEKSKPKWCETDDWNQWKGGFVDYCSDRGYGPGGYTCNRPCRGGYCSSLSNICQTRKNKVCSKGGEKTWCNVDE